MTSTASPAANPFLEPAFLIRWSQHTPEHIVPAIDTAIAGAQAEIDAIAAAPLGGLTFETTFLALERATEELNMAWGRVGHLQSVADSPALRAAHHEVLPRVTSFFTRLPLNAALWERLRHVAGSPAVGRLTPVHRRLLDETVADFRQHGADLPAESRTRLEAVQEELAKVTQHYAENVLDATNAWDLIVTDEARLAGLPPTARTTARESAARKGHGTDAAPAWRFTLHQPSVEPVLTYADDASLRREVWEASSSLGTRAPHDNLPLIRRILELRAERASLLGFAHFPDLVLQRRMAGSGARALAFEEDLQARTAAAFARECGELEAFAAERKGTPVQRLAPWDIFYWGEKLRQARYSIDQEQLRPWFPLDRVVAGLFTLVERVFGVRAVEAPAGTAETWHEEVRFYELRDVATGDHLGSFYTDWHPRETKRGGAWMNYLMTGGPRADGTRAPHLGLMCGNMTPASGGKPALLTHREVETVFHEFGHLLHHLLSEVPVKSLAGVNVAWDFVELPSQIMENWCWERESLDLFARHHETGEPLPAAMFERLRAAKNFRAASAQMRQLSFGKMDLLLHLRPSEFLAAMDLAAAVREAVADCLIPTEPPAPTIVTRFGHLFSDPVGYAAGYYSYKWAEVLDADAFTRFRTEGLLSPAVGAEFRRHVLAMGNSVDPAELYRRFMGRDPDLNALLVRNGLAA